MTAFTTGSSDPLPASRPWARRLQGPAARQRYTASPTATPGAHAAPEVSITPVAKRSRWTALAVAIGAPLVLAGCNAPSYFASSGATTQGHDTFKLWSGMMTTGLIIGGIVVLLILWAAFRYRRKSDAMPRQFHEHLGIELVYTVVPIIIVIVLFVFTVLTENEVDATVPLAATTTASGRPVVDITVTAFQWGWRFDYPHLDVGVVGELKNGPDHHGPQMVVPVGETVQITLLSADVVHGFYVRDFNFSRYALPGVTNIFDLHVKHAGTYLGQCTQFCGLYHSEMFFSVKAVSPAAFRSWAAAEVRDGHVLGPSGNPATNIPPKSSPLQPSTNATP
ncbi:MAG: cytochrome c oxidase subunit II [Acidimicrobiales bacterium]